MIEKKSAKGELEKFTRLLRNREHFSFQRYADGEAWILQGRKFQLSPRKKNHGYLNSEDWKKFDPKLHHTQREHLFRALRFRASNYYLGLIIGNSEENHQLTDWMIKESGQDLFNLTYANLFVNANYPQFLEEFVPEFKKWQVILVCNEKSVIDESVFPNLRKRFDVGKNCIVNDYHLIERIKEYVVENGITDHLFLFACSTLGNFAVQELFALEPQNTYIDCGSTLNRFLGLSLDRAYLSRHFGVNYRGGEAPTDALYREEDWPWG